MEILKEQNINVKKTYVATVKNDVVEKALSFYKVITSSVGDNNSIFPDVQINNNVFTPSVDENTLKDFKIDENLSISQKGQEVSNPSLVQEEVSSQNSEPVSTTNFNFSLPSEELKEDIPVATVSHKEEATLDNNSNSSSLQNGLESTMNFNFSLNNEEPKESPVVPHEVDNSQVNSIPDIPQLNVLNPTLDNNNVFFNQDNIGIQQGESTSIDNSPIRFDASHETNLLSALDENTNKGNISMTPENANAIREFGVDEPINQEENNSSDASTKGGFVNSKALLIAVIVFFLASCVFLGYEIYNYFILSKM